MDHQVEDVVATDGGPTDGEVDRERQIRDRSTADSARRLAGSTRPQDWKADVSMGYPPPKVHHRGRVRPRSCPGRRMQRWQQSGRPRFGQSEDLQTKAHEVGRALKSQVSRGSALNGKGKPATGRRLHRSCNHSACFRQEFLRPSRDRTRCPILRSRVSPRYCR